MHTGHHYASPAKNFVFIKEKESLITDYLQKPCTFYALSVFILLCTFYLENVEKKVYSQGVLERVARVTVNTEFFLFA